MLGLLNTVSKIFLLFNGCLSDTTKSYDDSYSQDYVLEDNYGLTDIQWLRFGGEYDEDNEWKVYEESSGKLINFFYIFNNNENASTLEAMHLE